MPCSEEMVQKLRGSRVPFFLVDAEVRLVSAGDYPFPSGKAPVQCCVVGDELQRFEAYTSGNRSIVLPYERNWFKAKSIGIPCGVSQPILKGERLYSYFLTEDRIGSGTLIWGFSQVDEAENEFKWMQKINDIVSSPKPVGIGYFRNLSVKEFKNRVDLFGYLQNADRESVLREFARNSQMTEAASVYSLQPTDVRVDEILYGFISPELRKVVNVRDCKDYLKWLGSSCGQNLRLLHDNNILHGTIPRYGGVMTNSHVGNHLVSEDATWITDLHMAQPITDKRFKEIELECLTYVMNPLKSAERIGRARFKAITSPMTYPLFGIPLSNDFIWQSQLESQRPIDMGEDLTVAFIDGVEYGYFRRKVTYVERTLRQEFLEKTVELKHELWKILGLPEGMQRGVTAVHQLMVRKGLAVDLKKNH